MTLTDVISKRNVFGKVGYLEDLSINNPSGGGRIEVGGTGTSYIDIKNPYSNDYDVRLGVDSAGTSARLETSASQNLDIYAGSGNLTLQSFGGGKVGIGNTNPSEKLDVTGTIKAITGIISNSAGDGRFDVIGLANAYIDLKVPAPGTTDLRIGTTGVGGYISTSGNGVIDLSPGGSGCVKINNIQTYANNAAAITGGLAVNSVYKTATGELRIVV